MSRLPALTGREVIRAFERAGFSLVRIRGSHHILRKEGCPYAISIPVHGGKPVSKGLLMSQIKLAGLSEKDFLELL